MADNKDIRNAIFGSVPEANEQVKEFAKYFGRNNQRESCKAIFDFLKSKINYSADGELQLIKLPSALLHTKVGDCKSYSLLTSAILTNLGIPHHFVLTSYNADPTPSHIYVETDDGCIIDAVWGIFDSEKKPTYKYLVKPNGQMKVKSIKGIDGNCSTYMGGCGCGCGCKSCGMGSIGIGADRPNSKAEVNSYCENKFKGKSGRIKTCKGYWNAINWGEKTAAKAGATFTQVGLSAGRNLFLIMVKANLDGIASKLQKIDFASISKYWKTAGGNPQNLQDAIKKGASKPSKKLGLLGLLKKKSQKITGTIIDTSVLENAIVPASAAAGTAIAPTGGTAAGTSLGVVLKKMIPVIVQVLQSLGKNEEADAIQNVVLSSEEQTGGDTGDGATGQSFEDFKAEMDRVFSKGDISKDEIIRIHSTLTGDKKSYFETLMTKNGIDIPSEGNTTTYLIIGAAALVGAYFLFNKKQ
jgi:hypothetical protein